MKFQNLSLVSLVAFAQHSQAAIDYTGHKLLNFDIKNEAEVSVLNDYIDKHNVDAWSHVRLGKVSLRLTPEQFKTISKDLTISHQVVNENIQALFDQQKNNGNGRSATSTFTDEYHSYAEITEWLEKVSRASKGAARTFTVGTTYEGRPIRGITFRKPGARPKKSIFYHGGIHANEWISPAVAIYLIDSFSKYTTDSALNSLLDSFEYTIVPVVNPDGYTYTRLEDRLWRKNRQPNGECMGTDLNRNWNFQWKSNSTCNLKYPGPKPFSAPETRAISNFISSKKDLISYIDIHAFGQMLMHPYGYSCTEKSKDDAVQDSVAKAGNAALLKVNGRVYAQGTICNTVYQAYGSSVDWAYEIGKVKYPFAIELPDTGNYGHALPASFIPSTGAEIYAAVKALSASIKEKENL